MIPLTDEENESYVKPEVCHICERNLFLILIVAVKICMRNIVGSEITAILLENIKELFMLIAV